MIGNAMLVVLFLNAVIIFHDFLATASQATNTGARNY